MLKIWIYLIKKITLMHFGFDKNKYLDSIILKQSLPIDIHGGNVTDAIYLVNGKKLTDGKNHVCEWNM